MNIRSKIEKHRNLVIILFAIVIIWLSYKFIFWLRTESTDNAYIKSDITFLSSKVAGFVTAINIPENSEVKKGDIIAQIDDTEYKIGLEQAKAKLKSIETSFIINEKKQEINRNKVLQLKSNIEAANSAQNTSQNSYNRGQKLLNNKDIAISQFERLESEYKKSKAGLDEAKFGLKSAQDELEITISTSDQIQAEINAAREGLKQAEYNLQHTKIIAPFDGVIGKRIAKLGQFVNIGSVITTIVGNERWIIANYKETQLKKIRPGQDVLIKIDTYNGQEFKGQVESISPGSGAEFSLLPPDNATGNFTKIVQRIPVKIKITQEDKYNLIPGMSAVATTLTGF